MSGNDDRSQAATDKLKAAALSAAKGLSRAQAERAAAAATRNVNAYGQKEEGPSRWQERKEAKRQMYLMSTEKAVRLGVKPKASATSSLGSYTQCQKCFQPGHWTYECKNDRVYISRPSRTQQLKNPKLRKPADLVSYHFENPDLEKEREKERRLMKEKLKKEKSEKSKSKSKSKSKRKHRSPSVSGSEASVFDSDTESSVSGSEYSSESSSSYSSSDSEDKKWKHKSKQKKRRHRRDSSTSSASSASDSASDSDSDDKSRRKKSKRRGDRR